ncbi:MAG: protein-L-isoaspartate(D-aspartate) O-methyltransferase [Deltaproteobacteria bacterium]|nr:protein-L-isoaspartate(D-aspartate) O-methyltransferase [Deltaproteobacteria bacterium]
MWPRVARAVIGIALGVVAACSASGGRPAAVDAGEASFTRLRHEMVTRQIAERGVRAPAVLQAMRDVPRHRFVNPGDEGDAYEDHPLGIGLGQTISQPYVVAAMTEALEPRAGGRVLEIGTGSGYQAAVLARLCRAVYTIEIVPELAERAARAFRALGIGNVHVRAGDGYRGWPEAAPFDGIMITAATPRIPQPLVDQLAERGRLVAPVDEGSQQTLYVYRKVKGKLERDELFPVRFVPMTGQVRERQR